MGTGGSEFIPKVFPASRPARRVSSPRKFPLDLSDGTLCMAPQPPGMGELPAEVKQEMKPLAVCVLAGHTASAYKW